MKSWLENCYQYLNFNVSSAELFSQCLSDCPCTGEAPVPRPYRQELPRLRRQKCDKWEPPIVKFHPAHQQLVTSTFLRPAAANPDGIHLML